MKIFEQTGIDRMQQYLDQSSRRQQVINSNLANVETPGYVAKELNFEGIFRGELENAMPARTTDPRHIPAKPALLREATEPQPVNSEAMGNDLNNVDMDREMAMLAENVLKFSAVAQLVQMKLQTIRTSIQGG